MTEAERLEAERWWINYSGHPSCDLGIGEQYKAWRESHMTAFLAGRESMRAELDALNVKMIEMATDHPCYALSKELESELEAERARSASLVDALTKLSKGNRAPGVLEIARKAIQKYEATLEEK